MKMMFRAALVALLALGTPALAEDATSVPPLHYVSRTLPNGLRVYSVRDPHSSNVSVQVWYDVGSRDDPRGRSGFAHLFEHMMFKASRNLVPEQFDRLTEDVGGFNNASTNDDYTNYYEVVPANHLQRLLWAEAERMGSLVVEQSFFASERDVVKEEYRSRVLAQPYGKMFYLYFPQISYDVLPYGRPGIGSIEDLDAATIEDVRAFHATYYRPDNAVLVVAGNFDQAELDRWVDHYFTPIARPAGAIPRVTAEEPVRTQARHYTVYEANTPLPAVMISYPLPPAAHPDAAALEVLDGILSTGESSRLHQSLVYRDQVAAQASSYVDSKQGRGNLAVYAILASGKAAEEGEAALRREIARFRDAPVSEAELQEAKNELLTSAIRERETADGQASAIAEAVIVEGDAAAADRRLAQISAVTPADIQRVARTWLRDERSAALRYLPEESRGTARGDTIATAATVQAAPLTPPAHIAIVQPAPEAERVPPPPPGADVTPVVPAPVTQRLANGLTVITVPSRTLPLVSISLVAPGGAARDPADRAGAASLAAAVMTEGTSNRSAGEIDAQVEALGTSLGGGAGWDGSSLGFTVRTANADRATALIADVARNATLPAEELERQRAIAADSVRVAMRDPGDLAGMVAGRALYGQSEYGHPSGGTEASLAAITRADIETAYRDQWRPDNVTLVFAGDIAPAEALSLAERHFGSWRAGAAPAAHASAPRPAPHTEVIVVDMPSAGQAAVAVARNGIARRDPRFYQALVANAVLGGGYSARLNQEIRIRRGLSYGSGSSLDARREAGPFVASTQTRNDAAAEVLGLILAEMRRLGAEPVPVAELNARRASLTGDFGRSVETTSGLAQFVSSYVLRGVDPAELLAYQRSVLAVTPAEAQAAAGALLQPQGATIVIVGDSSKFLEALRRTQPNVTVIPAAEINLDRPALR
ncbi:MAG TPA: pitrilysin family protein [Allosphingosinicella sp.]|nr:pitrilysin family protein [Allosphingosinicella sp.]